MAAPTRSTRNLATRTNRTAGRSTSSSPGRFARGTSTPRRTAPTQGLRRRRQPQQNMVQKVLGALPTGAAKKAAPSSKKGAAGGLALVAAAAGMAFKNRGKLGQLRQKDQDTAINPMPVPPVEHAPNTGTPPSTPSV